ncbi:MAG: hypothetical protein ACP5UH_00050 [Candidatus Micrarchaeia archaeon]
MVFVKSKKEIEHDVQKIKHGIKDLKDKNSAISSLIDERVKADQINSSLFSLIKYLVDENKKTTMVLQSLAEGINRLESELFADDDTENGNDAVEPPAGREAQASLPKELPVSDLDAKILQIIQRKGMACADDIKAQLSYKGRNAATARLTKLYKQGLLTRYQLGHKVFYKYGAGKTTNALIISPPQ